MARITNDAGLINWLTPAHKPWVLNFFTFRSPVTIFDVSKVFYLNKVHLASKAPDVNFPGDTTLSSNSPTKHQNESTSTYFSLSSPTLGLKVRVLGDKFDFRENYL
jgi:hypothetical protein